MRRYVCHNQKIITQGIAIYRVKGIYFIICLLCLFVYLVEWMEWVERRSGLGIILTIAKFCAHLTHWPLASFYVLLSL